jgi:transcriptional regulator with XRE-family HTH domain
MDFFNRVKRLAKKQGVTIEYVVNAAGLSLNTYNSYKKAGNLLRADEAVKMAKILDTTVEFLVTGVVDDIRDLNMRDRPPKAPDREANPAM